MSVQNFGTALGNGFVLNEATLMIGALGQAMDLTEEEHSLGLFKNLAVSNEKTYQPLTQGMRQDVVHQTLTGDNWTVSGNGYEYNPRTILYALGQAGYSADPTAARVKLNVTAPSAAAATSITVKSAVGVAAGDWIVVQSAVGAADGMAYQVESIAAEVITLDRALVAPVAVGDKLVKSTLIQTNDPNSCSGANYYSAKIVSADVNCNPIVLIIPKIQITSGLNLNFGVSDYSNMAFQGTPMASTRQDASYDLYKAHGQSKVFLIT
mgnify:CR=1 FL=1